MLSITMNLTEALMLLGATGKLYLFSVCSGVFLVLVSIFFFSW